MFRVLFLTLALFSAQAGPAVMTSLSVPLRTLRPYPTLLATLGVMPCHFEERSHINGDHPLISARFTTC